jgi:hypothetical protein
VAHALHRIDAAHPPTDATREETRAFAAPVPVDAGPTEPAPEPVPAPPPAATPAPAPAPASVAPRRRRGWLAALLAAVLALVVVAVVALTQLSDDPGTTPTTDQGTSDPETSDTSSPEEEQTTESAPETTQPAPAGGGSRVGFVEDYYSVLPGDTEAGYSMLSPSYQESTSYEEYEGFWSTVGEVTVADSAPAGPDAVDVTLLYDGGSEEVRRIYLERGPDGWLIADDEVVG